jgi:hypothetical protein
MSILTDAFYSLSQNINKMRGKENQETEEGVISDLLPELELSMNEDELIALTQKWETTWDSSEVKTKWTEQFTDNENYWLGKQFSKAAKDSRRPLQDNIIFESVETSLPQITRRNPENVTKLSSQEEKSKENLAYVEQVKSKLADIADEIVIRLKLKKAARHWSIYCIGVAKFGWDMDKNIPAMKIIRPTKVILDPDSTVDEDGYTGDFVGEFRSLSADILVELIKEPGKKKIITDLVQGELGTQVQFIEWWTNEYMCWTMGKNVLLKRKNPHWNYEIEIEGDADPMTGTTPIDPETGEPVMVSQPGFNHLSTPSIPFRFLSVFNLGKQPMDDTSLIGQNLSAQDLINKRLRQIDRNVDGMNGGAVVSRERSGLSDNEAKQATDTLRNGGTVVVATGSPRDSIDRFNLGGLPPDVFNQLVDTRTRVRDVFGTRGSSPAGIAGEQTVRGKILTKGLDADRVGGGISDFLEQFADEAYNYMYQLLCVYDPEFQGQHPKVIISVKEGSLIPKDSATLANQAVDLALSGKMSLIDMYTKLEYPNPEEMAANVWLEVNAPEIMFMNDPRVQQVMKMKQEAAANATPAQKPPAENMNFKDLPPAGQVQMAQKVGININPAEVEAHAQSQKSELSQVPAIPKT